MNSQNKYYLLEFNYWIFVIFLLLLFKFEDKYIICLFKYCGLKIIKIEFNN